jgi:hypothetical protein
MSENLTTKTATYESINELLSAVNEKLIVGRIFFDLSKAFDCVNNDILLSKLNFYGITGKANERIKSHLSDGYERVEIKDKNFGHSTFLNWGVIKYGVPQGSVSGPLLFILYINELSKTINGKSKPILLAHNTSTIFTSYSFEDFKNHIKIEFESLNKWFKANRLSLNFGKTHFTQFTTKNSAETDLDISCATKLIYKTYDTKFLGVYADMS